MGKKRSFLSRFKPKGPSEPPSKNIKKLDHAADRLVRAVRWLLNED